MARCDEGYLCEICGEAVDPITESDLYLCYIIGLIKADQLTQAPERHIHCNPVQAQFIVAEDFAPVVVDGPFGKAELDPEYVRSQEELVTRGWHRLKEISTTDVPVAEYPLPEFQSAR